MEIFDSYGKKCNSRFFLNYGFIVRNNDANEVPIDIHYYPEDKYLKYKKDMIQDNADYKRFRVSANLRENTMQEFFSWLRFVEFDENYTVLIDYEAWSQSKKNDYDRDEEGRIDANRGFKGKDLPALSIRNEKKCLLRMKIESEKLLSGYPTTLEQDIERLE